MIARGRSPGFITRFRQRLGWKTWAAADDGPTVVDGHTAQPTLSLGTRRRRACERIVGGGVHATQNRQCGVAPDGHFLINTVLDEATAPITLLMNWHPEAKK